jgi:hypothetical protein
MKTDFGSKKISSRAVADAAGGTDSFGAAVSLKVAKWRLRTIRKARFLIYTMVLLCLCGRIFVDYVATILKGTPCIRFHQQCLELLRSPVAELSFPNPTAG